MSGSYREQEKLCNKKSDGGLCSHNGMSLQVATSLYVQLSNN